MNWDAPEDRAALIEAVGPQEYNRRFLEHVRATSTLTNGYRIRAINTRFGRLFQVMGCDVAFREQEEAEAYANQQPKGGEQ